MPGECRQGVPSLMPRVLPFAFQERAWHSFSSLYGAVVASRGDLADRDRTFDVKASNRDRRDPGARLGSWGDSQDDLVQTKQTIRLKDGYGRAEQGRAVVSAYRWR